MKNQLFTLLLILISYISNSQSSIRFSEIIFPNVATLPTCNASEKGKTVLLNSTNQLYYCNGTTWNLLSTPSISSSIFSASIGGIFGTPQNVETQIPFNATTMLNVGNNFDNLSATYIVPQDGFYHFDFTVSINFSGQLIFFMKLYDNVQILAGNSSNSTFNSNTLSVTKYLFAGHSIKAVLYHTHISPLNVLPVGTNFSGFKIN